MKAKGASFLLSFKCPASCKHCSYKAGPQKTGSVALNETRQWLRELVHTQPLQSVGVHGGEPFLFFELVKQFMKLARELEIPRRWAITNSYWAKSEVIAKKKLSELRDAGLTSITFSVDAFHQEYIPLEFVKNAIGAALALDFEKIYVDSYFVNHPNASNPYDPLTSKSLESLQDLDGLAFSGRQMHFWGRAAELLVRYVDLKDEIPRGQCQVPFWIGNTIQNPEGIEIDSEGNITLCCGISIGNAKQYPLEEILDNYDCSTHPILGPIAAKGPIGLLKVAKEKGFSPKRSFFDECHLCYEIRKTLAPFFPQYLVPKTCY